MSFYQRDLDNDAILVPYLDRLYSRAGLKYSRSGSAGEQHCGVDLYLYEAGRSVRVDEKAQVHYLNQALPTFAFEIGYLKNGVHRKGWLFDEHKTTECYFLVVHICIEGDKLSSPDNIKSCKVLKVYRNVLLAELKRAGLDHPACMAKEMLLRKENMTGKIAIEGEGRFYYYMSDGYDERPFNLVIRLSFLSTIGEWIC